MHLEWFLAAIYFGFGLIFGSFLNVCIYRLPRGLSVVRPRSACPNCHSFIAWYDNIPVLSWMLLGGRCRRCHARITFRYAAVELLCGALFAFSLLRSTSHVDAIKSCVLSFLLVGLTFTDAETHLLPDAMTLPGLAVALLFSFVSLVPGPSFLYWPVDFQHVSTASQLDLQLGLRSLLNSATGAALGAGTLYAIGWIYLKLRKVEGMGLGDVKLMAMAGAFIGPVLTAFSLCIASLAGGAYGIVVLAVVFRKRLGRYRRTLGKAGAARSWQAAQVALRGLEIPFGVFLATTSLVSWFFGAQLLRAYLQLFMRL